MKTLKLFYNSKYFKPIYSSLEREVGDQSVMTSKNGATVPVYLISQQEMSQEQADLYFYLWRRTKDRYSFEDSIKYAIALSVKVSTIHDAKNVLQDMKKQCEYEFIKSENLKFARYAKMISKFVTSL